MKLVIDQPVPVKRAPKNVYMLKIEYMHGDADAYTDEEYEFKSTDEDIVLLKKAYIFAREMVKRQQNGYFTQRREVSAFVQEQDEDLRPIAEDLVKNDCTDQSYDNMAALQHAHITYFDANGIEYQVRAVE